MKQEAEEAKIRFKAAIDSNSINVFPSKYIEEEIELLDNVITLSDKTLYYGQTKAGKWIPHGFGVELSPGRNLIRVGYFYEGLKFGYFNNYGLDKNGFSYINKAFYEDGSLKGFAKIEQNNELILGVFENGKLNGPVYRKNNDLKLEQIAVFS